MGKEDKQMRKERNLRYQMRKKGYRFNREQRVAVLPEDSKNRSAVQEKRRKRVMAAIGGYLKATGKESNATVIKGIACRATGHTDFNKIPRERLRNLVAAFNNKVKDAQAVNDIADALLMQTLLGHGKGRQANA